MMMLKPNSRKVSPEVEPVKVSKAGRRPKSDGSSGPELSRDAVIQRAVTLAQCESIDEVSIARVARELGVVTSLIHYYIGNRDDLLSIVINAAMKERFEALPPVTGVWRIDLEGVVRCTLDVFTRWPGLATYVATHNRFRLFQRVQPGEIDYGLSYFDHVGQIFQQGGFTASQAALAYHLLMLFVTSIAAESAHHQAPVAHKDFILGYVSGSTSERTPGASFIVGPFAELDSPTTFDAGMELLLTGFEAWLAPSRPRRVPRKGSKGVA
ncbi:TetR/AcrR family transcriptional regulator [Paraburkholderia elongata]|nr:TetR/AcrR family transcriptional regulator C-terminal domain-containing protein [Paraburkholderia elongata]